jgi:hypothetical protein
MWRHNIALFSVLLLLSLNFIVFNVRWSNRPAVKRHKDMDSSQEMLRVVHLDLKGAPPRMHLFKTLFPLIAAAGANAILLEYEDMFPFEGILKNASAKNAYSREEVRCCDRTALCSVALLVFHSTALYTVFVLI